MAAWLVLPQESPEMAVMLTRPIYILMGLISHEDPPPVHGFHFN